MSTPESSFASRIFSLLALVKYIIEHKACIPFGSASNDPFMKPQGFNPYSDIQDRFLFRIKSKEKRYEIEQSIKKYHFFRRKSEDITRSLVVLYGEKGGQITLPYKICNYLRNVLELEDVVIKHEFIRKFPKRMEGECVTEWGKVYKVTFTCGESCLSIEVFLYNVTPQPNDLSSEGDPFIVSFIEGSIKEEDDGTLCLNKAIEAIDRVIRQIDLEDCF